MFEMHKIILHIVRLGSDDVNLIVLKMLASYELLHLKVPFIENLDIPG